MSIDSTLRRRLLSGAAFVGCSLVTASLMWWLLAVQFDALLRPPLAFLLLGCGGVFGWYILHRWRVVAPFHCASLLGVCGGIGGLGLYILCLYTAGYLFTPAALTPQLP